MSKLNKQIKKGLVAFYHTSVGRRIWSHVTNVAQRPFIRKAILKALNTDMIPSASENMLNSVLTKQPKHALVIFPYFVENAVSQNIRYLARTLRELGFVVHGLQFNNQPICITDKCFDVVHTIVSSNSQFRYWDVHAENSLFERNNLDDWVDTGLLSEVARLYSLYRFELCLVNYVFLSAAFNVLPKDVIKILYTHDVFTRRNKKLADNGVSPVYFDFSVSKEQECKGLKRADYIFSIQANETEYFKKLLNNNNVYTVPYIPSKNFMKIGTSSEKRTVGYIASGHQPNVVAINEFMKYMAGVDFELIIAGSICDSSELQVVGPVKVMGKVSDIDDFYQRCDVIINPDMVESGLKVKCIEAISRGLPLVCTRAASTGLPKELLTEFQLCSSVRDCFYKVQRLICSKECWLSQVEISKSIFNKFESMYSAYRQISQICDKKAMEKLIPNQLITSPVISVIVPVYNTEKYLSQAILSLLNQTLKNIEIIAIDDGSPDRCGEILDYFASLDNRVRVIHQPNGGYGKAINVGLSLAKGEFIAILEPDDWMDVHMFEDLYNVATKDDIVIKSGFYKHYEHGAVVELNPFSLIGPQVFDSSKIVDSRIPQLMLFESSIWSAIYRREFIESTGIRMNETKGASYQDVPWKFLVFANCRKVKLVNYSYYHYRVSTASSSSRSLIWQPRFIENYYFIRENLLLSGCYSELKNEYFAHFYLDIGFHYNRLSESEKKKFLVDIGKFFISLGKDWLSLDEIKFPEGQSFYIANTIWPIYKQIIETMKLN